MRHHPVTQRLIWREQTKCFSKQQQILCNIVFQYSDNDNIDLIVLPESSFTQGSYKNVKDALQYAQEPEKSIYFEWAQKTALRLKSIVVYGYPEQEPTKNIVYNSMGVVSEKGVLLKNYRKHYLYYKDWTYCTPGPGFDYLDTYFWRINRTIRCGLAICMDIWFVDDEIYEQMIFANFQKEHKAQLIIGIASWPDYEEYKDDDVKHEVQISYWLNRMTPLSRDKDFQDSRYFIWSDKCKSNQQKTLRYVGCSGVFQLKPSISHLQTLTTSEESVLEQQILI
eukprot:403370766